MRKRRILLRGVLLAAMVPGRCQHPVAPPAHRCRRRDQQVIAVLLEPVAISGAYPRRRQCEAWRSAEHAARSRCAASTMLGSVDSNK